MILGGLFKRFLDLVPKTPRLVGTVISSYGGGRYAVQLSGGGVVEVTSKNAYSVSARVFIEDQRIVDDAPALDAVTIDV